jgi:hypothetical protein
MFNFRRTEPVKATPQPTGPIPIANIDLNKRYDVHCADCGHDRLYENVRFLGVRTFERITEYTVGISGGFLEIEAIDGARWMIPNFGIRLICEHGTQPVFKILRRRRDANGW